MEFEWDKNKRLLNLEKHGIDFEEAVQIFAGDHLVAHAQALGEQRWKAIGVVGAIVVTVIYTIRSDRRRIISVRKARRNERREFEAHNPRRSPKN